MVYGTQSPLRNAVCFFLALLVVATVTRAQGIGWNVDFHGFADNREYAQSGRYSQSILGIRLAPELNFALDSNHFLHAGVNYLHEFGSYGAAAESVLPTIYYHFNGYGHGFYLGMFPREGLVNDYHRAILNDTLSYYRPNIEGLLWRYGRGTFHQQLWIDWTSRQTATDREQFLAGASGRLGMGVAYLAHQITLWHNAGSKRTAGTEQLPIRDNGAALIKLGAALTRLSFLDSADISVGGLIAYDRLRGVYDWRTPKGFIADLYAEYRSLFIANNFYTGGSLPVVFGDRFYTTHRYNRLDLGWRPLRSGDLDGSFTLSFHFAPGTIDNQQQLTLRYRIGKRYVKQR